MKNLILTILLSVCLQHAHAANIITLTDSDVYTVGANEVAEVISVGGVGNSTDFLLNGTNGIPTVKYENGGALLSLLPVVITKPGATISRSGNTRMVTIRIRTKAEYLASFSAPTATASTSVVIPEDAAGPVSIVMESSTDLVTWVGASPGSYGASTVRRFFRVRAIQN